VRTQQGVSSNDAGPGHTPLGTRTRLYRREIRRRPSMAQPGQCGPGRQWPSPVSGDANRAWTLPIQCVGAGALSCLHWGADNLKRRMHHYRTPGPTQPTNRRLNDELRRVLSRGGRVEISIATDPQLEIDGQRVSANMRHKADRVLIEHAALVSAIHRGEDLVINLARESGP